MAVLWGDDHPDPYQQTGRGGTEARTLKRNAEASGDFDMTRGLDERLGAYAVRGPMYERIRKLKSAARR